MSLQCSQRRRLRSKSNGKVRGELCFYRVKAIVLISLTTQSSEVRRKRKRLLKEQAAATHNIGSPSSDPSTSFQDRAENAPDEFIVGPSFETVPDVDVMSISGDSRQRMYFD